MKLGAAGRLRALVCLAFVLVASVTAAQPAPSDTMDAGGVELRYEAFAGCPQREAFAQNLQARRRGAVTMARAVRLDVRLSRSQARVEGSIAVSSDGGAPSARRIVAATCGEAADALALIAALALQGIEVEEVPSADRASERRADRARASEPQRTQGRPSPAQRSQSAATETAATPERASEPSIETETETATEPQAQAERAAEAAAIDERAGASPDETQPDDEEAAADTTRLYVWLAGGLATGVLPALQPLPDLALSWEHGARTFPVWSVQAGFRIAPEQTRAFEQGVVTFSWWTGLSAVCLGGRAGQLSVSGCATLELGSLAAGASETDNPRSKRRAWVALGPGATVAYDLTRALRFVLRAELLTPLARYRLELPRGSAVHEPSALGLRAELGLGLRLQ